MTTQHKETATVTTSDRYDVRIVKPGFGDVRLGPADKHNAELWATTLKQALHHTQHPKGTEITVEVHDQWCGGIPHDDPSALRHAGEYGLAELLRGDKGGDGTGYGFPDLYLRLTLAVGACAAGPLWSAACAINDQASEVDSLVDGLPKVAAEAEAAVHQVRKNISRLIELHDVEMAEGCDGSDALHELNVALRSLHHVGRIAAVRKRINDQDRDAGASGEAEVAAP